MGLQYVVLAPWVIHSAYSFIVKDEKERDISNFLIFPFLLSRMLHSQLWISLSRYRTAKGNNRIVDKGIEFDQVDRERDWLVHIFTYIHIFIYSCCSFISLMWVRILIEWFGRDDQILFNGILYYLANNTLGGASHLPLWRLDGVILTILLHAGPVEFLYYWLHRALHHHFLYSRYHSHHHSSIVTEPITCKSYTLLLLF